MRIMLGGIVAAALAFSPPAQRGQAPATGAPSISGRVMVGTGQDARPVRRAKVTVTGAGLAAPLVTDTDVRGTFRFARGPAGAHNVTIITSRASRVPSPIRTRSEASRRPITPAPPIPAPRCPSP